MKLAAQIFSLIFILVGCGKSNHDQNDLMNRIRLAEINGNPLELTEYRGKAVFINFWATWCKPCIQEMPTLVKAQDKFRSDNIVFLYASNEEPEQIEKFKKKHSFDFHYVRIDNLEELNIQALPTTYIFNADGKLEFSEAGFRNWEATENIELIAKIVNHEK